jgi:hypothetical protein
MAITHSIILISYQQTQKNGWGILNLCIEDMGGNLLPKQTKEFTEYVKSGLLPARDKICEPNATLLRIAGLQYTVYFSSSIYCTFAFARRLVIDVRRNGHLNAGICRE